MEYFLTFQKLKDHRAFLTKYGICQKESEIYKFLHIGLRFGL